MLLGFGSGALWGNRTDTTGTGIGPDQFGVLQDVSIDWTATTKELRGQYQFPIDIARADMKVSGKAKFARIYGAVYGDLFFGITPAAGQLIAAQDEAQTVPTTPFAVTVTNAAAYIDDLGVMYAAGNNAGLRFTRVTTPSAAGQYSVVLATGVYTFNTADAGAAVAISYQYTVASAGKKIAINNALMGVTPVFKATFYATKTTAAVVGKEALVLNACTASKLSTPTTLDGYTIQEFDFDGFADGSNNIGTLSTTE
jgi:hypothetical protein